MAYAEAMKACAGQCGKLLTVLLYSVTVGPVVEVIKQLIEYVLLFATFSEASWDGEAHEHYCNCRLYIFQWTHEQMLHDTRQL